MTDFENEIHRAESIGATGSVMRSFHDDSDLPDALAAVLGVDIDKIRGETTSVSKALDLEKMLRRYAEAMEFLHRLQPGSYGQAMDNVLGTLQSRSKTAEDKTQTLKDVFKVGSDEPFEGVIPYTGKIPGLQPVRIAQSGLYRTIIPMLSALGVHMDEMAPLLNALGEGYTFNTPEAAQQYIGQVGDLGSLMSDIYSAAGIDDGGIRLYRDPYHRLGGDNIIELMSLGGQRNLPALITPMFGMPDLAGTKMPLGNGLVFGAGEQPSVRDALRTLDAMIERQNARRERRAFIKDVGQIPRKGVGMPNILDYMHGGVFDKDSYDRDIAVAKQIANRKTRNEDMSAARGRELDGYRKGMADMKEEDPVMMGMNLSDAINIATQPWQDRIGASDKIISEFNKRLVDTGQPVKFHTYRPGGIDRWALDHVDPALFASTLLGIPMSAMLPYDAEQMDDFEKLLKQRRIDRTLIHGSKLPYEGRTFGTLGGFFTLKPSSLLTQARAFPGDIEESSEYWPSGVPNQTGASGDNVVGYPFSVGNHTEQKLFGDKPKADAVRWQQKGISGENLANMMYGEDAVAAVKEQQGIRNDVVRDAMAGNAHKLY